ncbi:MAG TPA: ABC transporter ATP-binding protein [Candidatus Saccharimonadales bacterium]|nr:ABC transporter ATP-binding protein [Candidatus Saccharimonadales bacterium]
MPQKKAIVTVDKVSKTFKLPHEKRSGVKQIFVDVFKHKSGFESQQVLKDISFEIEEGDFFGIVGRNGSGKSTLLKLLANIYTANKGNVQVNGSLTPFIELGVGFNPELTGHENVYLNGALLGFSRKEIAEMYDDIVEFAELERFMDQKLKNYSSGMQVRLAFSIAIRARSDILLLDEVLAVGDAVFQHKCFNYFKELKRRGQTVIFVSHDSTVLQEYCNKGILLEKGKIVSRGKINKVVRDYIDILNKHEAAQDKSDEKAGPFKEEDKSKRWGEGSMVVADATTYDPATGKVRKLFSEKEGTIGIRVTYEANKPTEKPVYGITIMNPAGQYVFQSNTLWSQVKTTLVNEGKKAVVEWEIPNVFNTDDFIIAPAVADEFGSIIFDWREDVASFKVRKSLHSSAFINIDHKIRIAK